MSEEARGQVYIREAQGKFPFTLRIVTSADGDMTELGATHFQGATPTEKLMFQRALCWVLFRLQQGDLVLETAEDLLAAVPPGIVFEIERNMLIELSAWQKERAGAIMKNEGWA